MDQVQFNLERADLQAKGYHPETDAYVLENCRRLAARHNCHRCKAHGLRSEVWSGTMLSVVFGICSACGYVEEI